MSQTAAVWFVVLAAVAGANLPFIYAITATLFLTLAFPGFVYRYLFKRHG